LDTTTPARDRILIVDDEQAILETLQFTFEDEYEVLTAANGKRALEILARKSPIAVVISDQRMPSMTGSEFLRHVVERYPETVRILLTGFADLGAIIRAVNEGHIYSYIAKPWEPHELKQVVQRAVEFHHVYCTNSTLSDQASCAQQLLEAVVDPLDSGCVVVDAKGIVRAVSSQAREILGLSDRTCGLEIKDLLALMDSSPLAAVLRNTYENPGNSFEPVFIPMDGDDYAYRVFSDRLAGEGAIELGTVIRFQRVTSA
jgi:CheY-like chemotaxis protein